MNMNIDWSIFQTGWDYIWEDPIGWFLGLPLLNQILILIGINQQILLIIWISIMQLE